MNIYDLHTLVQDRQEYVGCLDKSDCPLAGFIEKHIVKEAASGRHTLLTPVDELTVASSTVTRHGPEVPRGALGED